MKQTFIYNSTKRKIHRKHLRELSTKHETMLWDKIRNKKLGHKFKRQYSIGPYIVDFYCSESRLVIEVDGNVHKKSIDYDNFRSEYLRSIDVNVIRFKNSEIENNINQVTNKIKQNLIPPPRVGGGQGEVQGKAGEENS